MRQKLHTRTIASSKIIVIDYWRAVSPGEREECETVRDKVETALDRIRPVLQADGGDVELVDVKEGVVSLRLTGACKGCPMATITIRNGIERILREEVPEIEEVVAV